MKKAIIAIGVAAVFGIGQMSAGAATATLTWKYFTPGPGTLSIAGPDGSTPLAGTAGATDGNGDGFALQLGYFDLGTTINPFLGSFIPVFGKGGLNATLFTTASMGDNQTPAATGSNVEFSFTGLIDTSVPGTLVANPPPGKVMAIRYYNSTTPATATHYGTASNPAWLWLAPVDLPSTATMSFDMKTTGKVYQGGVSTPQTNMAIPEPGTIGLLGIAALGLLARRRR